MAEIDQQNPEEPSKEEIIKHIAQTLAERRQTRHVSLQAVSQRLKIRVPLLEAIESGKWDELPGEVYIRGFIIRYAQYLGLDGNQLIEPYIQFANKQETKNKTPGGESTWSEGTKSSWLWITLVIIIFIILVKFLKPQDKRAFSPSAEPVKTLDHLQVSTANFQSQVRSVHEVHSLEVFSPYQLWLKVITPQKVFEGFIPESSTWTFKSEGEFQIRLGHTREVLLKFDGRQIPLQDRQKTINLPSES